MSKMEIAPDVLSLLERSGMPNLEWWDLAGIAYNDLCKTLRAGLYAVEHSNQASRPSILIFPIGNFACRLSSRGEVLKCVALGTIRKDLYVEVAWQRVMEAQADGLKIDVFEISERLILLELSGILFSVRYLESPDLVRKYPAVADVPRDFQLGLPTEVDEVVESLRDIKLFNSHVGKYLVFQHLYYTLRLFMISTGLYEDERIWRIWTKHATFIACFDEDLLRELSWKVFLANEHEGNTESISAMMCNYFSNHNTCLQCQTMDGCSFYHDLDSVFARRWSENKFQTVHRAFKDISDAVDARAGEVIQDTTPNDRLYQYLQSRAAQPLSQVFSAESYVQITMQYSGQSQLEGTKMMSFVQEYLGGLIKDLTNSIERVHLQPWPTILVDKNATMRDSPYEGYWLIGINADQDSVQTIVDPVITSWNEKVCASVRFSIATMVVRAELISRKIMEQEDMKQDTRIWPRPHAKPDPRYVAEYATKDPSRTSILRPVKRTESPQKLRPATDVLSRLRHDPAFNLDDFVVGYTDRHAGILEKAAGSWVSESTNEEWIPQGRIQYFKRISDGLTVWDRAAKSDLVFGNVEPSNQRW